MWVWSFPRSHLNLGKEQPQQQQQDQHDNVDKRIRTQTAGLHYTYLVKIHTLYAPLENIILHLINLYNFQQMTTSENQLELIAFNNYLYKN